MLGKPLPPALVEDEPVASVSSPVLKYYPGVYDELRLADHPPVTPPLEITIADFDYEETHFCSYLRSHQEIDLAIDINVLRWITNLTHVKVVPAVHPIVSIGTLKHVVGKSPTALVCVPPEAGLDQEFHNLVNYGQLGPCCQQMVALCADQSSPFVLTNYAVWIFGTLNLIGSNLVLEIEALTASSTAPSVRSHLLSTIDRCIDAKVEAALSMRREAARSRDILLGPLLSPHPRVELASLGTCRRLGDRMTIDALAKVLNDSTVVDLLHDKADLVPKRNLSNKTRVVRIRGMTMVEMFDISTAQFASMLKVFRQLGPMQGSDIPYIYAPVIADPYRYRMIREIGLLCEFVEGVRLEDWMLQQKHFGSQGYTAAEQIDKVKQAVYACVSQMHKKHVAHNSLKGNILVHEQDLTVAIVGFRAAEIGGNPLADMKYLAKVFSNCI